MAQLELPRSRMTAASPRSPMAPVDVLLLKQENDPRRRTTITAALQLAATPDWARLVSRVEQATVLAPRLRHKVVSPLLPLGLPVWVEDRDFDLRYHLRRARVASPASAAEALEFVESFAIDSLDPARPLWQATLLQDDRDRSTLLIKVSHALMDGLAGIELLAAFVDLEADPPVSTSPRPAPHRQLTALGLTAERLVAFPWTAQRRYLRNTLGLTRANARVLVHPLRTTGDATAYAGSLKRLLCSPAAHGSSLLRGRSAGRRLLTVEVPHATLRAAGKAAGGSLNDAYLAGVLGALRLYHEALGTAVDEIPFAIPISTRGVASPASEAGNRFAPVRFGAPVGVSDPAERIARLSALVRAARDEPALDALTALAPTLAQLPAVVLNVLAREQDKLDAQASNVPGPPFSVYLAGTEVTRLFAFGPLPGPAVMAVLVSYAGTCCIGFTLDPAAVTDVELFDRCAQAGFAEVLALAPTDESA